MKLPVVSNGVCSTIIGQIKPANEQFRKDFIGNLFQSQLNLSHYINSLGLELKDHFENKYDISPEDLLLLHTTVLTASAFTYKACETQIEVNELNEQWKD